MKRVFVILHPGVEEIEALYPVDLLRRAGVEVYMASLEPVEFIEGRNQIRILPDGPFDAGKAIDYDLLFLPGGPAVFKLIEEAPVLDLIRKFHELGKPIAAICAAPLLLHKAGILKEQPYTSHASIREQMPAQYQTTAVVHSENLITSQGVGTSLQFSLALIELLCGKDKATEVAESIHATP